jgi:predicted nucleic acid-binding protein
MRLLIDTSAYSAFMRGHQEIKELFQVAEHLHLNPIILGELHAGFGRGRKRSQNEALLHQFLQSPRVNIFPLDEETAERYSVILNTLWETGTPIPTNDLWIAATAMQYGLEIVTTDSHFQKVVQVLVRHFSLPEKD